jgi:hypothetical protein
MKQVVLVFILVAAGATAGRMTEPSQTAARSLAINSVETNNVAGGSYCCGGPLCIPHEPCGSGATKLKIS